MYTYEGAVVKRKDSRGQWMEVDLSLTPIARLFDEYAEVYLILSNPTLVGNVSLNMKSVTENLASYEETVTVLGWLVLNDNNTLPTTEYLPKTELRMVKYNDAIMAGYKANLVHNVASLDTELPDAEKDDVLLTRPETDYELFYKNCLVTMNGLVHRTDFNTNGIYLKDAGKSFRVANQHHIGILSFRDIGTLDFVSITPEMVLPKHPDASLEEGVFINLPEPIGNRIAMMVIGGYLHILDRCYQVIGDKLIHVKFRKIPFAHRFFASKKLMDLTHVTEHHQPNPDNPDHVAVDELLGDDSIRAYLTLSNSFVVLLNADNLYVEKRKLEYSHLPGLYYSHQRPMYPLMTELGRLPEYLSNPEQGRWTVSVQDNLFDALRLESFQWVNADSTDGARNSSLPFYYAPGYLLEIGSDLLI